MKRSRLPKGVGKHRSGRLNRIFFSRAKLDELINKWRGIGFSADDYDEVVDYVVDQVPDRLMDAGIKAQADYDNGLIVYGDVADKQRIEEIVYQALEEKIADVEYEKRHGERD